MRLYVVRIFVDDFPKARAFYTEMLELEEAWAFPEMNTAGFKLGSNSLIIEQEDPAGEDGELVGRFVGISIQVDNIADAYRLLSDKGVTFKGPPRKQFWGSADPFRGSGQKRPDAGRLDRSLSRSRC